jgi:hypothetical protein
MTASPAPPRPGEPTKLRDIGAGDVVRWRGQVLVVLDREGVAVTCMTGETRQCSQMVLPTVRVLVGECELLGRLDTEDLA